LSNLSIFVRSYFKQSLTRILIDIRENRVRVETLWETPIMLYCKRTYEYPFSFNWTLPITDPVKRFLFANKEFFRFSLLSFQVTFAWVYVLDANWLLKFHQYFTSCFFANFLLPKIQINTNTNCMPWKAAYNTSVQKSCL